MRLRNRNTPAQVANKKFHLQKRHAKSRDIPFHFSFRDWVCWWESSLGSDWMSKRGRKVGQYVMARLNDTGPYSVDNVKCVTCSENQSEQVSNNTSGAGWNAGTVGLRKKGTKLSDDEVLQIYSMRGTYKNIALQFRVDPSLVSRIKTKNIWKTLTDKIDGEPS